MLALAEMRELDLWYTQTCVNDALIASVDSTFGHQIRRTAAKAKSRNHLQALAELTRLVDGQRRLASDPPLLVPIDELVGEAEAHAHEHHMGVLIRTYLQSLETNRRVLANRFRYVGMARKVVGVGSVGTRAWIVLLLGQGSKDPLFLQAKEAQASVLEPYVRAGAPADHGRRVVEGQRLMQAASDDFLGWVTAKGSDGEERCFYVRQLWDGKGSAEVERMSAPDLAVYGALCGKALARAHARSGDRIGIASYLGKGDAFDEAIAHFGEAYADQNQRDYERVVEAAASGEVAGEGQPA
jgi:uncharacterized protein (DUF2252 family)